MKKHFLETHSHYGTFIARIGIAAVFLWFGLDKFIHTSNWIGWVPNWMQSAMPISITSFMYIQGVIETLTGILLLIGCWVRFAGLIGALTLIGVEVAMIGTGQTEMMLRDAGLLAATLSLFLTGSDCLSIDCILKRRK